MKVKTTLSAALAIGLLAATAVGVAAQTEESPSGTFFTGTVGFEETNGMSFSEGWLPDVTCLPDGDPLRVIVDDVETGWTIDATDPRISGVVDAAVSTLICSDSDEEDEWSISQAGWVEYRITNDKGSWTGSGPYYIARELEFADPRSAAFMHTMVGEGGYEGLTAVFLRQRDALREDGPPGHQVYGVILPGSIPAPSDFEGSAAAFEDFIPDPRAEEEGDDGDTESAELTGAMVDVETALGDVVAGLSDTAVLIAESFGTLDGLVEYLSEEDPDRVPDVLEAMETLGTTPDAVNHYSLFVDDGDSGNEPPFEAGATHFPGVDPLVLREVMDPANGNFMAPELAPGTEPEELTFGDETVYRLWVDGVPMYWYVYEDVLLTFVGSEGPDSTPDEAAVSAFFTGLLSPAA